MPVGTRWEPSLEGLQTSKLGLDWFLGTFPTVNSLLYPVNRPSNQGWRIDIKLRGGNSAWINALPGSAWL